MLVESHDFAKGTSSRATKLVHGGVRYLAQGNIALVREALHERTTLLRNAPHLAQPLPFVMPSYRIWERPFYGAGLKMYDALAGKAGLEDEQAVLELLLVEHVAERDEVAAVLQPLARRGEDGELVALAGRDALAGPWELMDQFETPWDTFTLDSTLYVLELPKNGEELVDTALFLLREVALATDTGRAEIMVDVDYKADQAFEVSPTMTNAEVNDILASAQARVLVARAVDEEQGHEPRDVDAQGNPRDRPDMDGGPAAHDASASSSSCSAPSPFSSSMST